VPYFHIVFTLPHELCSLILQNKRLLYDLLFRTSAASLLELARDPQHLGADIGFLGVLHTWGQNLQIHPHVHYIVPAGGLALDGSRWIDSSPRFFLPVKALSHRFRKKFCEQLCELFQQHRLQFHSSLQQLASPDAFRNLLSQLEQKDWVVYAKPPFGGTEQVLNYLARYTHRVAISNHRLVAFENDRVSFRWRDYAHGGKNRVMTVSADEFLRRFLLHVLPKGLVRIRHFKGFALDAMHRPHITLIQRFVRTADLDKVYSSVGKVFANANLNGMKLEAFKYYYAPAGAVGVAGICAKPTPEILKLQADIIAAMKPFTVETGPIGAFTAPHDDPAIDAALIQYVSTFVPKMSGGNYNPHVSTGVAPIDYLDKMLAEPFQSFTFWPAGAAVYQLGPFGTAAKKLKEWDLKH
jgi:hypothetical protein